MVVAWTEQASPTRGDSAPLRRYLFICPAACNRPEPVSISCDLLLVRPLSFRSCSLVSTLGYLVDRNVFSKVSNYDFSTHALMRIWQLIYGPQLEPLGDAHGG
jgi:hypothetical protein